MLSHMLCFIPQLTLRKVIFSVLLPFPSNIKFEHIQICFKGLQCLEIKLPELFQELTGLLTTKCFQITALASVPPLI